MNFDLPTPNTPLSNDQLDFVKTLSKACRRTIVDMVKHSQSGHPGGSLSALDLLTTLYAFEVTKTDAPVVISNGHISPAGYSVLVHLGLHDEKEVITTFRQAGSIYEGHVTRHVQGVHFGTGPLGAGVSVAAGMAMAEKIKGSDTHVWAMIGDGEAQEGQVHEMMLFAAAHKLGNFTVMVDYNAVQLTDSLENMIPTPIAGLFRAAEWNVLDIDGHDHQAIWTAIEASKASEMPTLILGRTIMGMGVLGMEEAGREHKSTWHGKAPKPDMADVMLATPELTVSDAEYAMLKQFHADRSYSPEKAEYPALLSKTKVNTGEPRVYTTEKLTDCRSAYGAALLDISKLNSHVVTLTADLMGSVKTDGVAKELPGQYVECGICEQHMVSACGGISVRGMVPFCSTFGAFMSSRAKDQARVNDINYCNVKMVSTHCGLSVGEDGPTHQAIDDMGSFVGLFNTHVCEPADPNHCDRIIRYAAGVYGPFYVRMGRHKLHALTHENGDLFFGKDYEYVYGKCDVLREGEGITIVATGAMVHEALKAKAMARSKAEIVITSSIKQFDETLRASLQKTGSYITIEDHNPMSGLGAAVNTFVAQEGIVATCVKNLGVRAYQLSGQPDELYASAECGNEALAALL